MAEYYNDVLVLDENGTNLGKMHYKDAKHLAVTKSLDLILINKNETTPVFKIMDHGKWKYEQNKNKQKKQVHHTKEMNFNVRIDQHDVQIKVDHIKEFLKKGMDVKITVSMKGREKATPSMASDKMKSIVSMLDGLIAPPEFSYGPSFVSTTVHPGSVKK